MSKKILLIDDNPDDLYVYTRLLNQANKNYEILTAETLEEAVLAHDRHDIYCTFIDYNLPMVNGINILDALNDRAKGRVLAVIILTGEPHQTIQAEAARRGALDYIIKDSTNTPEQLDDIINKTAAWAASLNENQHLTTNHV